MGKTIADALKEEGKEEGALEARQQTLIRLLQKRFGELSADVVSAVESTDSKEQLDKWLDQIVTAKTLAEMGIKS